MQEITVSGGVMRYTDVGDGPPLVFVHGNPSSSAEFLPAIDQLQRWNRCIAADHIGFGASDKPPGWDYLPSSHAGNLALLLDGLDLTDVVLVVGDWGGPIGLSWALANPGRIAGLVITNTWMWPLDRSLYYQAYSRLTGGPVGRFLTLRYNFFAKYVTRLAWGNAVPLDDDILAEFTSVHATPDERNAMWILPREIVASSEWLGTLWGRRTALSDIPMTFLWGMADIAFRADILERWVGEFPTADVVELERVGHFPALEATDELVKAVSSLR